MTVDIRINGQASAVDPSTTVADVVHRYGIEDDASGIAVAVNDAVVPRREWNSRRVVAGDTIEIIRAVQGG